MKAIVTLLSITCIALLGAVIHLSSKVKALETRAGSMAQSAGATALPSTAKEASADLTDQSFKSNRKAETPTINKPVSAEADSTAMDKDMVKAGLKAQMQKRKEQEITKLQGILGLSVEQVNELHELQGAALHRRLLKTILTADQLAKYDEERKKANDRKNESAALELFADIQRAIQMSDDQKDSIYQIIYERQNNTLNGRFTPPQKGEKNDPQKLRDAYADHVEGRNASLLHDLAPVLDDSQLTQLEGKLNQLVDSIRSGTPFVDALNINLDDL